MRIAIRLTILLSTILFVVVAGACQARPAEPDRGQAGGEASLERVAAEGVEQALETAPQIADEIGRRYGFHLPQSVPWWAAQPVAYEEGDATRGVLRLHFHKQHYRSQERASDELALLWQQGKVEGSPDASFQWAARAGIDIGERYEPGGTCVIDGHECQIYLHRRPSQAGDLIWRVWYDDRANRTYALVTPEDEPEVGRAFEQEFHGSQP